MLILGHVGITFGVALVANALAPQSQASTGVQLRVRTAIVSLTRRADLRLLLLGSLLPDIVDKPVGIVLLPEVFGTGRLFCHSLVFPAALATAGIWLYRSRRSSALLVLAYGAAMHLILDAMWRSPSILLWPFAGPLPRGVDAHDWLATILSTLLTNPAAYLPEIAGGILLVPLLWAILRSVGLKRFARAGAVD